MIECTACGESKPPVDFDKREGGKLRRQCRQCLAVARHARNQANPDQKRRWNLTKLYGITLEEYEALLVAQGGVCALNPEHTTPGGKLKHWHVDHDHKTGRVRGLLCRQCNLSLGGLGDDEEGLLRALAYVSGKAFWAP